MRIAVALDTVTVLGDLLRYVSCDNCKINVMVSWGCNSEVWLRMWGAEKQDREKKMNAPATREGFLLSTSSTTSLRENFGEMKHVL